MIVLPDPGTLRIVLAFVVAAGAYAAGVPWVLAAFYLYAATQITTSDLWYSALIVLMIAFSLFARLRRASQ